MDKIKIIIIEEKIKHIDDIIAEVKFGNADTNEAVNHIDAVTNFVNRLIKRLKSEKLN